MNRSIALLAVLLLVQLDALHAAGAPASKQPNILWLIAEDAGPDFGCYGNAAVRTPNIDRLARESRLYRNAFSTSSVCSTSRSAFMTGVFQTRLGASNHRSHRTAAHPRPAGVKVLPERLREAGYFTGNIRELPPELGFKGTGKTDWNFFQTGQEFETADWRELKARAPFYAQINVSDAHRLYRRAERNPADPAAVTLPPYLADDPVIRDDWAAYLDSLAALDAKVGAVLELLQREGLAENTVVFFFADNGREDFRGKYYSYEQGFRVPLLVRWPALLPPGSASDELVSLLDVHATTLALAGVRAEGLDGWPIFSPGAKSRDFVFTARDRIDDTPDRVRTVRDARFKYIRNFEPERPYLQRMAYAEVSNPTYNRMRRLHTEGKLNADQRKFMAAQRPPEELYDLQADPFELNNLAGDARHRATRDRLRAVLAAWLKDTRDESAAPEDPADLEAQMKNLEKIVAGHRQKLGPSGRLESVPGAPPRQN